ncbi:MAG TPA: hypothetical protein VGF48_11255 [Thermoanaerobaculia bacterium]|jgi:hypothetical protein
MKRTLPLVLAILLFGVAGLLWIVSDRRAAQRVYDEYSTPNQSKRGLSLAYAYLGRTRKVAMLTAPFGRDPLEPNAVVFRLARKLPVLFDPEELDDKMVGPPKPKQQPLLNHEEEAFVRRGGRFIIAADEGARPVSLLAPQSAKKVFPIWPGVTMKIDDYRCQCAAGFDTLPPRMHAIFAGGRHTVLGRERIGAGELFLLSEPGVLANERIRNHLPLLDALAGNQRPVYFDEVLHGIVRDDGALAMMQEWNLGPFLLLLLATTALLFWRHGRRIGPADDDDREGRSDAVDLVRSLGALYRDATNDAAAIALYHDSLKRTVALTTGLRGEQLEKCIHDLTGGLEPPDRQAKINTAEFRRQLQAINDAFARVARKPEAN